MTEITRETLELAALAIGGTFSPGTEKVRTGETWDEWEWRGADGICVGGIVTRPHTDIADAARLAIHLGIRISVWPIGILAKPERAGDVLLTHNGTESDKERAYCEAVTLCAAGIGRRMKEAK